VARDHSAPKPESLEDDVGRLLLAIEAPPCGCKLKMRWRLVEVPDPSRTNPERTKTIRIRYMPRCPHVEAAEDGVPVDLWLELMRRYDRTSQSPRPYPVPSSDVANLYEPCARVRLYAERRARGEELFHPLDIHQRLRGAEA
jgi:hypothetical protein